MRRRALSTSIARQRLPLLGRRGVSALASDSSSKGGSSSGSSQDLPPPASLALLPPETLPAGVDQGTLSARVRFLETLGVQDVPSMVQKDPKVLTHDLLKVAAPRLEYLLSLGVDGIGTMVSKAPELLCCDITHELHRRVAILQALGVRNIPRWLQVNPHILDLDVDRDMRPAAEFLRSIENVPVGKVVEALPRGVFGRTEALKERVRYLHEDLGIQPMWKVGMIIKRNPNVLLIKQETMQQKVGAAPLPRRSRTAPARSLPCRAAAMRTCASHPAGACR